MLGLIMGEPDAEDHYGKCDREKLVLEAIIDSNIFSFHRRSHEKIFNMRKYSDIFGFFLGYILPIVLRSVIFAVRYIIKGTVSVE